MQRTIMVVLTLLMSGRAMTLAFIHRVGGEQAGDPPSAWLMPLLGDAVIGLSALFVAYMILKKNGLWVWTSVVVWNVVAIWDALSAYVIHSSNPWPEFFMIQHLGPLMFINAAAIHIVILVLACNRQTRQQFFNDIATGDPA